VHFSSNTAVAAFGRRKSLPFGLDSAIQASCKQLVIARHAWQWLERILLQGMAVTGMRALLVVD